MNWKTWDAIADRHAVYRDVLIKLIGDLPDRRPPFEMLIGRQRRHAVRIKRHLQNALTLSDGVPD